MRKLIVANWKMNLSRQEGINLAQDLADALKDESKAQIIICPPFTHLAEVGSVLEGSKVALGAQDCAAAEKGAYTGQIAAKQLADFRVSAVILGHAERRSYCFETSAEIKQKAIQAQSAKLIPIICIGETESEKSAGQTTKVLKKQIEESCPNNDNVVLAYEPLWAIGTGRVPSPTEVAKIIDEIKKIKNVPVIYGGSVKTQSAKDFLHLENLDGILVGGAALKIETFLPIIKAI
ncbi:MAG: triose-phosphate isomerase [Alphaproteobacteria bacterium]|nr:triose-phosphate isomerase [Alphaproteobacteria bacterium]MBN2780068.1 triose-phosphate isomerase [Alphaproteobacteria bacterium]